MESTWTLYARVFAEWMDTADLATYNKNEAIVEHYSPGTELRERSLLQGRSRGGIVVPPIQYAPIEVVAVRIVEAIKGSKMIDWKGMPRTTRGKALAALAQLGLIVRISGGIRVTHGLLEFVENEMDRESIFAERALQIESFSTFVNILHRHQVRGCTLDQLGLELSKELDCGWKKGTSRTNAKIMLNWARNANLAPGEFKKKSRSSQNVTQLRLSLDS